MLTRFIARRLPSDAWQTPVVPADTGDREGFFGERAASIYDERTAEMFDPAAVEPVALAVYEEP
jgi:hypothetical protein